MNWDVVESKWSELSGKIKTKWSKLTDIDLKEIAGKKESFLTHLQKHYSLSREKAETELNEFMKTA